MTAKEFLLTETSLNLTEIGKRMYGTTDARSRLSNKIHGHRGWTAKDEERAIVVLKELGERIEKL